MAINIKKSIINANYFLGEENNFDIIVSICGLYPINDWYHWEDTDHNTLIISKKKNIVIKQNSKIKIETTNDIFKKSVPQIIASHSYWVLYLKKDINTELLCFMGMDGRLRVCLFINGIWQDNMAPLLLGIDVLRYIISSYREDEEKVLTKKSLGLFEMGFSIGHPILDVENNPNRKIIIDLLKG